MLDAVHNERQRLPFDMDDALDAQQLVAVMLAQELHDERQLGPIQRLIIADRERADAVRVAVSVTTVVVGVTVIMIAV